MLWFETETAMGLSGFTTVLASARVPRRDRGAGERVCTAPHVAVCGGEYAVMCCACRAREARRKGEEGLDMCNGRNWQPNKEKSVHSRSYSPTASLKDSLVITLPCTLDGRRAASSTWCGIQINVRTQFNGSTE